jgi:hypothetical protein
MHWGGRFCQCTLWQEMAEFLISGYVQDVFGDFFKTRLLIY